MMSVLDDTANRLGQWQGTEVVSAATRLLGQDVVHVDLDRIHFPARRPVQVNLMARDATGSSIPLLAEYCPDDPQGHAQQALASLRKSRNGQKPGLCLPVINVAKKTGLVVRRPGFDERLPGLRLLHDPAFARSTVGMVLGRDSGPVAVELVAHRLGKRAVLRLTSDNSVHYARIRAIKSSEGTNRLALHRMLWAALRDGAALRIPEPIGVLHELGISLFAVLPGHPPDFGSQDCAAIARALDTLQALNLVGLPQHSGADEARLLTVWLDRCRVWRPDIARRVEPGLVRVLRSLEQVGLNPVPCHRDLHEKQVLIERDIAGFLDFDTLCVSHPALDAGNLLAHLFLAGQDEDLLRGLLDRPGLDLWRRAALFRLAMIYSVTSTPDSVLHRLIEEAFRDAKH